MKRDTCPSCLRLTAERERITGVLGEHPETDVEFLVNKIFDLRGEARHSADMALKLAAVRQWCDEQIRGYAGKRHYRDTADVLRDVADKLREEA